ncbi:glycosyltransferase [Flavobacteriaceae bacterium]|nr:glycosyltransferase [Flavobacteriaceae bacterium]
MKKSKLLIVGAFPCNDKNIYGGILKSCNIILESEISKVFELFTLNSCQISNPPPNFFTRSVLAINRIISLFLKLISKKPEVALIFSSDGASAIEKGVMILICKSFKCKTIIFPRAGELIHQVENSKLMHKLIGFLYLKSSIFLCQGKKWEEFAINVLGISKNKVKILNNWTATDDLIKIGKARNYDKKIIYPKLLFVGWIEKTKGVFDLMEISNNLYNKGIRFDLTLVGGGNAEKSLKSYVNKNNLNNVKFLGWLNSSQLTKVFKNHDIFVFPSWFEGMPNVLIEAMASGLAVISSSAGVISDNLSDGKHALLSKPRDNKVFQQNLEKIILNQKSLNKIAINGHELAKSKFSSKKGMEELKFIINDLIH